MIGWNFPLNNSGQEIGPQNSGIETFLNDPLRSLAKEICQNSCDARDDFLNSPVEVHFELETWDASDVPGIEELRHAINQCAEYWHKNRKGRKLFERARAAAGAEKIRVLKISDYNTEGLTGSGSKKDRGTNWHNLVKAVGTSDKPIGRLGSFGIGKHAPFACSSLRTVFYSTLDRDGSNKLQGVSILATHETSSNETTQGTGYYGVIDGNLEIDQITDISLHFQRKKVGTDVYIIGFGDTDDWESRILHSVLDDFFKAIFDNLLIVKVGNRRVTSTNLGGLLAELGSVDPDFLSPQYYESITHEDAHYYALDDFEGFGRLELYLLPRSDFPKKVAMVRRSGMVIFDKAHFRTPVRFVGVMQIRGPKADAFFQQLEPPAHNRWEASRYDDDPKLAESLVNKVYTWINDCVREMSSNTDVEEQDVPGLSKFLPDDTDDADVPFDDENVIEEKTDEPLPAAIDLNPKVKGTKENARSRLDETASGEQISGEGAGEDLWGGEGEVGGGDGSAVGESGAGEGVGSTSGSLDEPGETPITVRKPITLKSPRCFCTNPEIGLYEILFTAPSDSKTFLSLRSVGESENEQMKIISAKDSATGEKVSIDENGTIGPYEIQTDQRYQLEVTLPDHVRCALELTADED